MPVEFTYRCDLPAGLHARPCSRIAELAERSPGSVTFTNRRNARVADAKSVLSLISADVLTGDECAILFSDDDAAPAQALRSYLEKTLPAEDAAFQPPAPTSRRLPRALRLAAVTALSGSPLSEGFEQGQLLFWHIDKLPALGDSGPAGDVEQDLQRAHAATDALRARLAMEASASSIIAAHLAILADPAFAAELERHIRARHSIGDALVLTARHFSDRLRRSQSAYIRARVADIEELCGELYRLVYGARAAAVFPPLAGPSVLVAESLGAQELLRLDRRHLRGIVFPEGQSTSHAAILARSLGIPAIAAESVAATFNEGAEVILDGTRGQLLAASPVATRFYQRERALLDRSRAQLRRFVEHVGATADGVPVEVAANVSSAEEAEAAFQNGCDGVGLFRTEMLYVGRDAPPTEKEQSEVYRRALQAAAGRPVIFRTFDLGADKPAPFLKGSQSQADRGILIYKEHPDLLRTQLRALLRAAQGIPLRIMVPLVSTRDELSWIREQLRSVLRELGAQPPVELGIMIELPEAVKNLEALAPAADFFSIGTNDLAQYFFQADRTSARLDLMQAVRRPEFLRLLHQAVQTARRAGKWIGMCGEMAGDPRNLPLLLGMGLNELSMAGQKVLLTKSHISELRTPDCQKLLEEALVARDIDQVESLLDDFSATSNMPLLAEVLMLPSSESADRDSAIRELAEVIHLAGRTPAPDALEDALWDREATYPTDMSLGFALPHCKSAAVKHSSIAVLRAKVPFLWSPESTVPVRAVIALAMTENAGEHMQVLSKLARRLMDEEFRERLLGFTDSHSAVEYIAEALGLAQGGKA